MPSKRKRYERDYSSDSHSDSTDSSDSDSKYQSKERRRKKKRSKRKHKDRERRSKRHRKDRERKRSSHRKKSKSKSKSNSRSEDKNRNDIDNHDRYPSDHDPIESQHQRKKRKLNPIESPNPCASTEMIENAQTVVNMICENNNLIKSRMKAIFSALDQKQVISLSDHTELESPLKMIFTFLSLRTEDDVHFIKTDDTRSLIDTFKTQIDIEFIKSSVNPTLSPIPESVDSDNAVSKSTSVTTAIGPQPPPPPEAIGVTMPTEEDLMNNRYSSDDEDDGYGPASSLDSKRVLQMEETKIYAEMTRKIEGGGDESDDENAKNKSIQRPEWMTSMPQSFLSDFDKGTKARGFMKAEQKQDTSWTEAPGDLKRQKEERKRIKRIRKEADAKLRKLGLPTVEERELIDEEKRNTEKSIDEPVVVERRTKEKSLFEIHQETLMEEYKEELKEWKRKKKRGEKVGKKPVFKGVKQHDNNTQYAGNMESYYNAQNPVFRTSKLKTFVSAGTIDQC